MELFYMRRRIHAVLLAIAVILAAVLSSCSGGESGTEGKRNAISFLRPQKMKTASAAGNLYDLTQLIPDEGGTLCSYGLYDETHLLLLRGRSEAAGDAVSGYTAQLFDLCSGVTEDLASFDRAGSLREDSDGTQYMRIVSAVPLIVHDSMNDVLYLPESEAKAVVLPEWLRGASPFRFEDRTWISSERGILYEITEEGALRLAWKLPSAYGPFYPVVTGHSGTLSFITCTLQEPSSWIFVDMDPAGGTSRFYRSGLSSAKFSSFRDGLLVSSSFRDAPRVTVSDPEEKTQKEMTLPEEIRSLLDSGAYIAEPGDDGGFLAFQTVPLSLCGDWCSWMLCDSSERPVHIYLWDTASCRSTRWRGTDESEYTQQAPADYDENSRIADEIASRYGVSIVLGDNIPREFSDYSVEPVVDAELIRDSLTVLDNTLSLYPDGFFRSLKGDYYRDIVFYLTGAMKPLNESSNISNASAFATEYSGLMQIAFDLHDDLSPATVIHELTHAADYRFAGEGLLDEESWNAMNPAGFSYYLSYIDEEGESYETAGSGEFTAESGCPADEVYFIDPYSKTFPMEDRARLMETLLSGRSPYRDCFRGIHVQEKLSYYFRFLRQTLGDKTWPSSTTWEEALINASSSD